jgi:Trypsin-co-occurring domain 2
MTQPEGSIPLADLIDAVRGQLEAAARNGNGRDLQFEVQEVNLEVDVTTTGTREGQAGVQVWVLTLGAKGSKSNAATHKVTLKMNAVGPGNTRYKVKDSTSGPARRN